MRMAHGLGQSTFRIWMLHAALEPELAVSYFSMMISEHEVMCQGSKMIISQGSPSYGMGWHARQPYVGQVA